MHRSTVRWGVLSTANIGRAAVIPAIQQSGNGDVVAVASRDLQTAADFAQALNIPQAYGDYQALLEDDAIDAVYIPLPNSLHREWVIKAAAAGKHILCEKPLALTAAECAEMAVAARQHGVKLMEAFMYRFHPRTERVLTMVQSGALGDVHQIHAAFTFRLTHRENIRFRPELGGGALMDVGCYCVNVARTLAGREPVSVQARAHWGETGVDDRLAGTLQFADGLIAQFDCALTMARRESYLVAGTERFLEVPNAFLPGTADVEIIERDGRGQPVIHTVDGADEYQLMVEHFADCVLHDRPLRYDVAEAAANMRTIEALYRSARAGGAPERIE